MAECVKSKFRHFMCLLYPDDTLCNHKNVIESLHLYNSVWILHNQDLDDNGNLKKEHIHAILSFVNPRYLSAVSNELGLDERWIEPIRDVRASMAYLLHLNDSTKHTYSIDECHGNVDSLRKTLILRRDVKDSLVEIFSHIDNSVNPTMRTTFRYCVENDLTDVYVSHNLIIKNYLRG